MSSANDLLWPSQPLFMGILALHNLEEILSIGRDAAFNQKQVEVFGIDRASYRQDRMALATGLAFLGAAVAGALGGNAAGHLGRALAQRRYNGGLATSFVILPRPRRSCAL